MISLSLLLVAVVLLLCVYKYLVHPSLVSPLSKIPNAHITSSFSPAWILWTRYKSIENRTLHQLHKKLGPVIRLGPKEISVNCVDEGIRTIYSGGFEKNDWYSNLFENYGVPNMFSTAQGKPHSVRKRMISNVYSKSYLQSSPDMHSISQMLLFGRLLPLVEDLVLTDTPVDVHELNFAVTMDFINAYIFGLSNGSNFLQDVKIREHWLDLYQSRKAHTFWPQELPKLKSVLHSIGITVVPPWVDSANREIEAWCLKMCEAAELSYCSGNSKSDSLPQGVVFDQLRQSMEKPSVMSGVPYPKQLTIASELLDHLAAGHETSGITLTYLIHELSQRPHLQASLRDEVRTLTPSLYYKPKLDPESSVSELAELPSSRAVDALPLLHAVLMETLRRHAAIPGPQPRTTPHNLSAPVTLGGYSNIPSDVRVSALAWTLHRNEEVFPEPETWKPERWFDASTEVKDEMMRWFWAFGSGGRMCIGSHFAIQEMKLVVAAVYANYKTSIIDDEGIEQADMYTAGPKGNKLIIKFERH